MCWWCFAEIDGAADYCPRCRRSLRVYPEQWVSARDPSGVERCPTCESRFTRTDYECPECGRSLRASRDGRLST
ncbi:double zinc ribbon domain-containing protein [Curtobacterium sp. C1]|uniref:double zinc ribbon domain-containing protein n=1 Tax=Curtobacterium sp. C1 TaxID=2898151 RepID=UPI003FA40D63